MPEGGREGGTKGRVRVMIGRAGREGEWLVGREGGREGKL
jgi:hypothetical protein